MTKFRPPQNEIVLLTFFFQKWGTNSNVHNETKIKIFSESLEDENIKLLEMIRQREKTIKNLEVKTRNALEISIKADDGNLVLIFSILENYF